MKLRIVSGLIVMVTTVGFVSAQRGRQEVRVEDLRQSGRGGMMTADVGYSSLGHPDATGLGLRIHFDSSKVSFQGLEGVLEEGLVGVSDPQPDTENFDGDVKTDQFVLASWADLYGQWPGREETRLFRAVFAPVSPGQGKSAIRFSASSHAAGMDFAAEPLEVDFERGNANRGKRRGKQIH